ncbi:MAG: alpha/beta fold hydrolase [Crenarchaeota archaeon]|nr:alpha/beta fold hydrolase [Thermoproteota archaeon]
MLFVSEGGLGRLVEPKLKNQPSRSYVEIKMIIFLSHFLLLMLLTSLCTSVAGSPAMLDHLAEDDLSRFYAYDKSIPLNPVEELIRDERVCKIFKVYFNSVNSERVPALISIPSGRGKHPCVVFLHGYGGSKEDMLSFASLVAAEGYAVIAIDAEFHGERREKGKALYSPNLEESRNGIIQTIIDLRRAVDYLETKEEIDVERIGYVGGSMGGILGAIFIGVEPRIKAAALLVAGGNMSLMIMRSQHPAIPAIRRYMEEQGMTYKELQEKLNLVDPLNFIGKFAPRPVVFHLGKYDRIVPAEAGEQLYKAAGEPKQVYWYDSGHDLPLELVASRILDFMDRELKGVFFTSHEARFWVARYGLPMLVAGLAASVLAYAIFWSKHSKYSKHTSTS